jgi:hypothetical protein
MKEKTLLKLAITSSLLGVLFLAILSYYLKAEDKPYSEFKESDDVSFSGKVMKIVNAGNVTIMTVAKNEYVDVVVFEKVDIDKDSYVQVSGEVKEYEGKMEVIADNIVEK